LSDRLLQLVLGYDGSMSEVEFPHDGEAISLTGKLATFTDLWSPKIVSRFNGHDVMVVKCKGAFNWHAHPDTDDFFLVLRGTLRIELKDRVVEVGPNQLFIVPKGVEHRTIADEEVHLLLIEPAGTPNTGDERTAATKVVI
jgi:mannose-6-phosphate isomerase-like protein (cupin superfamily)